MVAVMHQSTFTLREDLRRQERSDGGDIRRGHPVLSVSCLGFLLEDACLCVHHRTVLFSGGPPPVVCRYLDRTNRAKLWLSHLDLAGRFW